MYNLLRWVTGLTALSQINRKKVSVNIQLYYSISIKGCSVFYTKSWIKIEQIQKSPSKIVRHRLQFLRKAKKINIISEQQLLDDMNSLNWKFYASLPFGLLSDKT